MLCDAKIGVSIRSPPAFGVGFLSSSLRGAGKRLRRRLMVRASATMTEHANLLGIGKLGGAVAVIIIDVFEFLREIFRTIVAVGGGESNGSSLGASPARRRRRSVVLGFFHIVLFIIIDIFLLVLSRLRDFASASSFSER